jgi:predicted SAM-dependent methyltransferase
MKTKSLDHAQVTVPRPIAVMSFDRPHYLEAVLNSLKEQTVLIETGQIFLFQDGYRSKNGGDLTSPRLIEQCIELFQTIFPGAKTFAGEDNLGVALNFARAENYLFGELGVEAAYFFEDDLLLSPHYLTALGVLTEIALQEKRIAYVAAYGDHRVKLVDQKLTPKKLIPMRHKWGFAITRRQWSAQRDILEPYLQIVSRTDYRSRDSKAIRAYFEKLGYGSVGTSQDGMKDVASCILGTTKVMTAACFAKYIGETGLHSRKKIYDAEGFGYTEVYPEEVPAFELPSNDQIVNWIDNDRANGKEALESSRVVEQDGIRLLLRVLLDNAPEEAVKRLSNVRSRQELRRELPKLPEIARSFPELRAAYEIRALKSAVGSGAVRLIIGAASTESMGWVSTNQETLDLLKPRQWGAWLDESSVQAIVAEHVWEHLSIEEGRIAASTSYKFLAPGGRLRIAVPDGYSPDTEYIRYVKPRNYPGHKTLFTIDTLSSMLESEGFVVRPLEYFDKSGIFREQFWSAKNGLIMRSRHRDHRNQGGEIRFTSLILDGIKPSTQASEYKFTLGPATVGRAGWDSLDPREFLGTDMQDLANEYMPYGCASRIVTEHWIDKLSPEDRGHALNKLYGLLGESGRVRIAVRDANFPGQEYQRMDPDHPGMTWDSLTKELHRVGFAAVPLEWFDTNGQFCRRLWDTNDGFILRSAEFDDRNRAGELRYTSLIIDAIKETKTRGFTSKR